MSEYQVVEFRAIDRPLSEKQLAYMERQSSHAEFSKWDFAVEYHYSSFRGDIDGMMRNGYDLFLLSSSYGQRELRIRIPGGLPFSDDVINRYLCVDGLSWSKDKQGDGGILRISPPLEDVDYLEVGFDELFEGAAVLREMLISGDMRALYFVWLCCLMDFNESWDELIEPPVPHGLLSLPTPVKRLLSFFEIDPLTSDAAGTGVPEYEHGTLESNSQEAWIRALSKDQLIGIVQLLLTGDPAELKASLREEMRASLPRVEWPVSDLQRSAEIIFDAVKKIRDKVVEENRIKSEAKAKRDAAVAEKKRQSRLVEMRSSPDKWLKESTKLVEIRGTSNYEKAATILADLRDAIGGVDGEKIAKKHAAHLAKKHSTLKMLKSSLRKCGLLD